MSEQEKDPSESLYSDTLIERVLQRQAQGAKINARRRVLLSATSSVAMAASASAMFIVITDVASLSGMDILITAVALLGLLIAIVLKFLGEKDREARDLAREIYHLDDERVKLIREWIAFESLSRRIAERNGPANMSKSLIDIIESLSEDKIIGELDTSILKVSIKSRNEIVHTGQSSLSRSEEALLQERLSDINKRLFVRLEDIS